MHGVDVTAMQALIDTRNQLDRHAAPDVVEWHVAGLSSRWARRAFAAAGFGYSPAKSMEAFKGGRWKPIFSVAATVSPAQGENGTGSSSRVHTKDEESVVVLDDVDRVSSSIDNENGGNNNSNKNARVRTEGLGLPGRVAAVQGVNRPWFHIDVVDAVESAIASIEGRLDTGKVQ